MTKNQVGEEKLYLDYTSALLFITKGSQDRLKQDMNLEAGADTEGMERCCLLACFPLLAGLFSIVCSAYLLIEPRTSSPEMVAPNVG